MSVPYYDQTAPEFIGTPYFMGNDELGHSIYFMGMWNQRQVLAPALVHFLTLGGVKQQDYIFQDSFPMLNFSTKVGGALSKRFRCTTVGRRLSVWGIQQKYPQFVALVEKLKEQLE